MSSTNMYNFNQVDHLSFDSTDISQKNLYNDRFSEYNLTNYFSNNNPSSDIGFAIDQPAVMFNGTTLGTGLSNSLVDVDSDLLIKAEQDRACGKLQLFQRPFITVPYLGRGSGDILVESQLLQGEMIHDKKSVSTIMDKSFNDYSLYVIDDHMKRHISTDYEVTQNTLNGWNIPTRLSEDEYTNK